MVFDRGHQHALSRLGAYRVTCPKVISRSQRTFGVLIVFGFVLGKHVGCDSLRLDVDLQRFHTTPNKRTSHITLDSEGTFPSYAECLRCRLTYFPSIHTAMADATSLNAFVNRSYLPILDFSMVPKLPDKASRKLKAIHHARRFKSAE